MAAITNTYLTFAAKGQREALSDVIYQISPEDTPGISMCAKSRAKAVLNDWQTDSLAAAVTTNKQLEGDDHTSFPAITPTARVGNYQQISHKLLLVSGTLEAVDKAGRDSEIAYQTAQRGAELKRDMEATFFANQAGDAGGTTTARATATLGAWLKTNVDKASDGTSPTYTAGVPNAARTDGTLRAFTETILKAVAQSVWTSGGKVGSSTLFVGPVNKTRVSGFAGIVTKNYDISTPKPTAIIGSADVYVSEWGVIKVMPSRFQRERDAWLLDPEYLEIQHLRPFHRENLAKTGDAEKRVLRVEWGIKVRQEAALGLAADLTTT